jgi:hypothetical protein
MTTKLLPMRLLVAAWVLLGAIRVEAQGVGGTISGTVKDETGAVLPGVTILIKQMETGLTRELVSDDHGRYLAPNLPPGPYEITATLTGFAPVVRSGIRLTVGRDAVVDFSLRVGQIAEQVLVVGESPLVETRSASTGGLIAEEQIKGLPLNGRSFIELANLTPGVLLTETGGRGTSTGFGSKLSVHGSRYTANLFTLDGTMLNDQFNQAGSASGNVLGVEAIREFQVLTNSFSAEYGRHTGAVINAATKSGSNAFHGSLFEFHRNDALDARNFFDPPGQKPDFTRNQFGFSLGGPIRRERTFFFGTYEGLRERLGQTLIFTVPSEAVRNGPMHPAVRPYVEAYPLPNGRALGTTRGEYLRQDTRKTDEHYAVVRIDHQFSPGSTVFARYTFDDGEVTNPNRVLTGEITKTRFQFLTVEHTAVRGSGFVNRAQFGFTRSRLDGYDYVLPGANLPRLTFTDITRGIGVITVTGLSAYGGSSTNPKFHRFNNFQVSDTATFVRGAHNLRFGGHLEFQQYDLTSDFTSMGQFTFRSLDDFLANRPRTFNAVLPGSDTQRRLRQQVFGFFVQDDIQVRSNLTLNVGVRYEPTTGVTEVDGKLAQLIDFASPTATLNDTTVVETLFKNPSLRTFAPRVGFAWDLTGDGKTALRGGAGVFYDLVTTNTPFVQNTAVRVPPFFNRAGLVASSRLAIDFPDAYFTQRALLAGQAALEGIQYEPEQPRMYKWNVNLQRELWQGLTVEVGYTGTRGDHLFRQIFTNGRVAVPNAQGRLVVPPGQGLRQPNFDRMRWRTSDANSWYDGLTVGVTRRGASFFMQASYTWSKSEDTGASALGGNDFDQEGGGSRYLFDKDKGLSPFDIRHSFVANVNVALPFGRSGGPLAALVRNWEVGTLVRLRSGYPFSVFTGIDRSLQVWAPDYPDLRPGASPNPILGGPDRYYDPTAFVLQPEGWIGNLPRNSLIGPGMATVDVMLARSLRFGASRAVQLRLEVFNLLNRANFGLPSQTLFNAQGGYLDDAGRIRTTVTSARQIQLGVRFVW